MRRRTAALALSLLWACTAPDSPEDAAVDPTPTLVSSLPASHGQLVLSLDGDEGLDAIDVTSGTLVRMAMPRELAATGPNGIGGLWWNARVEALRVLVTGGGDAPSAWLAELDARGHLRRPTTMVAATGGRCFWHEPSDRLACLGTSRTDGATRSERFAVAFEDPWQHLPAEMHVWDARPVGMARAVLSPDGTQVVYSAACERSPDAWCLYRADVDGHAHTVLARARGEVCNLIFSPDATRVVLVLRTSMTCSQLAMLDPLSGALRGIADFVPAIPRVYEGIVGLAFSPDGERLAVLSDHEPPNGGNPLVGAHLFTIRDDGRERRRVSDHLFARGWLIWLP